MCSSLRLFKFFNCTFNLFVEHLTDISKELTEILSYSNEIHKDAFFRLLRQSALALLM